MPGLPFCDAARGGGSSSAPRRVPDGRLPAAITRFGLERSLLAAVASRKVAEVLRAVRRDTLADHCVQSILLCQSLIESLSSFQFKPRGALFPRLDPARLSFVRFHPGQNASVPEKLQAAPRS